MPTGIEKRANQANAEEVIRQVQGIDLPENRCAAFYTALVPKNYRLGELTMAECNNPVQCVEYYRRVDHLVVVQLPEVLDFGNALLVELELVLLEAQRNLLENVVYNSNHKVLVVSIERTDEDGQKVDIAVFDLNRLAETAFENPNHLVHINNAQIPPVHLHHPLPSAVSELTSGSWCSCACSCPSRSTAEYTIPSECALFAG